MRSVRSSRDAPSGQSQARREIAGGHNGEACSAHANIAVGNRYALLAILGLALAIRLLTAWPLHNPGYTDAYYYAAGARELHAGHGFQEPFVWNYLDPPAGVPHAGYLYWMPLSAILGWLGMALLGPTFRAIQMPFVLLSALLPLVAYAVAWDLTRERRHALLAALLAVFPGFYAHVFVLPDNFSPFALAGAVSLWSAGRGLRDGEPRWFALAGLAAGAGHLARADGLLLQGVVMLAAIGIALPVPGEKGSRRHRGRQVFLAVALALAGYLALMVPWFIRNWQTIGAPLSSAGMHTLFLTTYDDIFAYGRRLSLDTYLASGWSAILRSKLDALWLNLQRLWVENLLIVLLPFTALGLWRLRRNRLLWPFFVYAPLLFGAMTFAFTFPGTRGGLFHSAGALLPFFFGASGPGLDVALRWAARRLPHWRVARAWPVFGAGLVGLAILLTAIALGRAGVFSGSWNARDAGYAEIGSWLAAQEPPGTVVMVGNAPGFTWHTGYPAIAVPNEPLETIVAVAGRYGARYLVLDGSRPRTTDTLYERTASDPRLAWRYEVSGCQVYAIGREDTP